MNERAEIKIKIRMNKDDLCYIFTPQILKEIWLHLYAFVSANEYIFFSFLNFCTKEYFILFVFGMPFIVIVISDGGVERYTYIGSSDAWL